MKKTTPNDTAINDVIALIWRMNMEKNVAEARRVFGNPPNLPTFAKDVPVQELAEACDLLRSYWIILIDTVSHEVTPESFLERLWISGRTKVSSSKFRLYIDAWTKNRLEALAREVAHV